MNLLVDECSLGVPRRVAEVFILLGLLEASFVSIVDDGVTHVVCRTKCAYRKCGVDSIRVTTRVCAHCGSAHSKEVRREKRGNELGKQGRRGGRKGWAERWEIMGKYSR